jgi:hypothetical protein
VALAALLVAPVARADIGWLPPADLPIPGGVNPAFPAFVHAAGVTSRGDTLVVYGDVSYVGNSGVRFGHVMLASKPAGASAFGPPTTLDDQSTRGARLAVAADGSAAIVWPEQALGDSGRIQGVIRRPDGSLTATTTLASFHDDFGQLRVFALGKLVANPTGTWAVGLETAEGTQEHARVAIGTPADGFDAADDLAAGVDRIETPGILPQVVVDDDGDATAAWLVREAYQGGSDRGPTLAYAARMHAGAWAPAQTLAGPEQLGDSIALGANPAGDAVIARSDDAWLRVYSSRAGEQTFDDGQVASTSAPPEDAFDIVESDGRAEVGWMERPDGLDHALLRTVARPDAGSSFGAPEDKLSLPHEVFFYNVVTNRRGDMVMALQDSPPPNYDDNTDVLVWRTGPDTYASELDPTGQYLLTYADLSLDEDGNALVALQHRWGPADAPSSATVAWRAAGAPALSKLPVPPGSDDVSGALNQGRMVVAGMASKPARTVWASLGNATEGFGDLSQDLDPAASSVRPVAIRDEDDAVVFTSHNNGEPPFAIVRGSLPESPGPQPSPEPSATGPGPTDGGATGGGEAQTTPTPPVQPEIAGTTTSQAGMSERLRSSRVGVLHGNAAEVRVSCTTDGPKCVGVATLLPAANGARAGRSATLGRGRYAVPAGKSRRVRLRLNARGRRALRGHATLRARLRLQSRTGASTSTTTVVLRRSR